MVGFQITAQEARNELYDILRGAQVLVSPPPTMRNNDTESHLLRAKTTAGLNWLVLLPVAALLLTLPFLFGRVGGGG